MSKLWIYKLKRFEYNILVTGLFCLMAKNSRECFFNYKCLTQNYSDIFESVRHISIIFWCLDILIVLILTEVFSQATKRSEKFHFSMAFMIFDMRISGKDDQWTHCIFTGAISLHCVGSNAAWVSHYMGQGLL